MDHTPGGGKSAIVNWGFFEGSASCPGYQPRGFSGIPSIGGYGRAGGKVEGGWLGKMKKVGGKRQQSTSCLTGPVERQEARSA